VRKQKRFDVNKLSEIFSNKEAVTGDHTKYYNKELDKQTGILHVVTLNQWEHFSSRESEL